MAAQVMRRMSLAKASILVFVLVALLTTLFMVKMTQGEAAAGSADRRHGGPALLRAVAELGPEPDHDAERAGHHHRRRHRRDGDGHASAATAPSPASPSPTPAAATRRPRSASAARAREPPRPPSSPTAARSPRSPSAPPAPATRSPPSPSPAAAPPRPRRRPPTAASTRSPLANAGTGYTVPTVDFDMPDDPNGTQATGPRRPSTRNGAITGDRHRQSRLRLRDGAEHRHPRRHTDGPDRQRRRRRLGDLHDQDPQRRRSTPSAPATPPLPTVTIGDAQRQRHRRDRHGGRRQRRHLRDQRHRPRLRLRHRRRHQEVPGRPARALRPRGPRQLPRPDDPDAKYIPLGVPEQKNYNDPNGKPIKADEYEIGLVQYRTKFSSDLPATLVRGYVQLETPANAAHQPALPADQRAAERHQGRRS